MTGKTTIAGPLLLMTGLTGFHAHHLWCITGNPSVSIGRIFLGLAADRFMTGQALHFSQFDMGGMREKDIIRLLGIISQGTFFFSFFQFFFFCGLLSYVPICIE